MPARPAAAATSDAKARLASLPLRFEENLGQADPDVRFLARSGFGDGSLRRGEAVLAVAAEAAVRMRLEGANPDAEIVAEDELGGCTNYYAGADPGAWRTGVRAFGRVRYREVYPGVDLVFYGRGGELEYDFVVAPGADPSIICVKYDGARSVKVDGQGDLALTTAAGQVRLSRPSSYQPGGARGPIPGRFRLRHGNGVGFDVGAYDRSLPLVVDPALLYSTYWGDTGSETGSLVAVDSSGAAYVVGTRGTMPVDFLTKLTPAGDQVVFTTYFGGVGVNSVDTPYRIALGPSGDVYVGGTTNSPDFPVLNAFDSSINGGFDGFVTRFGPTGTLLSSTFIGGNGSDAVQGGIVVDSSGAAYVAGRTMSTNFPTANAYDASPGGFFDVFLLKLTPAGNALVFSTYLGGSQSDDAYGLALDGSGSIVVCGYTTSDDFPTLNAYDSTRAGSRDAFVTKFAPDGQSLVYSTYFGGTGLDQPYGVGVNGAGEVYFGGDTSSTNLPLANAYDSTLGGTKDGFFAKLSADGQSLVYSTYVGGSGQEFNFGFAVARNGAAILVGFTESLDFPAVDAYDATSNGGLDAFVAEVPPEGGSLLFSTYLGGSDNDVAYGVTTDATGAIYVVGQTSSTNFPTVAPYHATLMGTSDAFMSKFEGSLVPPGSDTAGVYVASSGAWFLRNSNTPGPADAVFGYGPAGAGLVPLDGDWDGDGDDTPGLYDPATGVFFLRNSSSPGPADLVYGFGPAGVGWVALVGDWDGNGTDTVALYDPLNGFFFLRNQHAPGGADLVFGFGPGGAGWTPLSGDWDGNGTHTVGLYDPANSFFFLRNQNASGAADLTFGFGPGGAGWTPLSGDFDGDGDDTVALYDPASGFFFLRNSTSPGPADVVFGYGPAGTAPLVGDWDGI
jgi:hypothetical protein